jgi:hypothetical protein
VKRWLAVINHSRMSGKPPQAAEIDWHGDLQKYLAPESEVIQITIYRSASVDENLRTTGIANHMIQT